MPKNRRLGYGFLGICYIFMLAFLVGNGRPGQTPSKLSEEGNTEIARYLFPEITTPEQIIGMELTIPSQNLQVAVVVEDEAEGRWRLRDAPFTRVDAEAPQTARIWLGSIQTRRTLSRQDLSDEVVGLLPNPQYVVRFQIDAVPEQADNDGRLQVITLQVGDITPTGDAYYLVVGTDNQRVEVVPVEWINTFVGLMLNIQPYAIPSPTASPGNP